MTVVALAGDWHGNTAWARARIMSLGARGIATCFHLGDFGFWPGKSGRRYVEAVDVSCRRYDVTLYVTLGNHDWPRVLRGDREQRDDVGAVVWLTDHVAVLPRGHRFVLDGRSFVSLGGAPSLDVADRTPGEDWWEGEAVTAADVERVAAEGYADVMLAHDAPGAPWQAPAVARICADNPEGWPPEALRYAAEGRALMSAAFLAAQPRVFAHGHFHVRDEALVSLPDRDHDCLVLSLGCDEQRGNVALLDLETLSAAE